MAIAPYQKRREEIEHYFDRTAVDAWSKLTSTEPVGRIRQTVREGRDQMRANLLSWLPQDLSDKRILDAGCGTGLLACDLANRGANVVAIDISPTLIDLARERVTPSHPNGKIRFEVGDMSHEALGEFDYVIAMDSLIHYRLEDAIDSIAKLGERTRCAMYFTFAPRTRLLAMMHAIGRYFPSSNRSPSLEPVCDRKLRLGLMQRAELANWSTARDERVSRGFYMSHAYELVRS